ncbi:hypothetical protein FA15DRAFT_675839 [Coprinopsis marcescibilis]|uniref:Uncharacterized protein n=1 Tax=Coprinopsis marcescibilis TaxID=230819 RepID=A0A5C3KCF3_COPMA|nr:hypothetical protein FA15DRAFT_675839 [Coprinopsis marcescibilis]
MDPATGLPANLTFHFDVNEYLSTSDLKGEVNSIFFQAFCVNPPKDYCPDFLGPCPNSDVTGIGSQISTYITSLAYAIVVWYIPWMGRPMLYAHLSVVYSLLIAAVICIAKSDLTQNDGIFVLVSVASPATIYLWYLSVVSLWQPHIFPVEKKDKRKSLEIHALRVLSIGTFVFEIALICLMYVPSETISFSQPACNKEFGMVLWFNIAWMLPIAIQTVVGIVIFLIAMSLCWLWTRRLSYKVPEGFFKITQPDEAVENVYTRTPRVDMVTWTESILLEVYPDFMSPTLATCVITVLQLVVVPSLVIGPGSIENILSWLILAFGCFKESPREGSNAWKVYGLRIIALVLLAGVVAASALFAIIIPLPSLSDLTLVFLTVTVAIWSVRNFSTGNMKIFLPPLVIFCMLLAVAANVALYFVGSANSFDTKKIEINPDLTPEEQAEAELLQSLGFLNFFMITMATYSIWFVLWCSTAFWSFKIFPSFREFYDGIFARAHILKFTAFVVTPIIIWVQSCNQSNPTDSMKMNFGQIFSLIVSFVTIITLIDEARVVKKPIWAALFFSRRIPDPTELEMIQQMANYGLTADASIAPRSEKPQFNEKNMDDDLDRVSTTSRSNNAGRSL